MRPEDSRSNASNEAAAVKPKKDDTVTSQTVEGVTKDETGKRCNITGLIILVMSGTGTRIETDIRQKLFTLKTHHLKQFQDLNPFSCFGAVCKVLHKTTQPFCPCPSPGLCSGPETASVNE